MSLSVTENDWRVTDSSPLDVMRDIAHGMDREDPFYILDVGDLVHKVETWRRLLPRVEIFYAVKCNDDEAVLRTLAALGTGFDCASKVEISKVMREGVSPSRIIFAHPCKPASFIKYSSKIQLPLMTFDSREELHKIRECYPEAQLVLRIRCDSKAATYTFGKKYGVDVDEALLLLSYAVELDLQVIGVAFHVGSGCQEPAVYQRAIASAREVFNEAAALGMKPYLLDIGGGFSGNIHDLGYFASVINAALEKYFPEEEGLRIIAEPGRYIVTSAFTLATRIMATKCFRNDDKTQFMYFMNDGVYGSFSTCLFEEEPFTPKVLTACKVKNKEEDEERETVNSTLWGPTCCALDVLKKSISLPELSCGDWLYWQDMGAYTLTNTSNFNGFPLPDVYVVVSPECRSRLQETTFERLLVNREGAIKKQEKTKAEARK